MITADRYIRTETLVSTALTGLISGVIFVLVFGVSGPVKVWGMGGYAFDLGPQSLMTALLCTWVPGMVTRKRLSKNAVSRLAGGAPRPRSLLLRGLLYAVISLVIGGGAILLSLIIGDVQEINWAVALTGKVLYGGGLAALITPVGLRALLREPPWSAG